LTTKSNEEILVRAESRTSSRRN